MEIYMVWKTIRSVSFLPTEHIVSYRILLSIYNRRLYFGLMLSLVFLPLIYMVRDFSRSPRATSPFPLLFFIAFCSCVTLIRQKTSRKKAERESESEKECECLREMKKRKNSEEQLEEQRACENRGSIHMSATRVSSVASSRRLSRTGISRDDAKQLN